jgi:hypothetical protein
MNPEESEKVRGMAPISTSFSATAVATYSTVKVSRVFAKEKDI